MEDEKPSNEFESRDGDSLKKLRKRIWLLVPLVLLSLGSTWIFLRVARSTETEIIRKIEAYEREAGDLFKISNLTNFNWDTVCLFYGYDNPSPFETLKTHKITNISDHHQKIIKLIEKKSDIRFFIFSLKGEVVETLYYDAPHININGKIFYIEGPGCLNKSTAAFRLENTEIVKILWLSNLNDREHIQ